MNQETGVGILRSAGVMGIATFFSRILGLVREQVFAFLFGATHAMDAFNIAFRIPNLLRDLFAEGAMSTALVPVFTQVKTKEGEQRAWRIASLVIKLLVVVTGVLALLGIVFSKDLVWLYASAYQKIPGKFELTVQMTQVIFPFFPLIVLAAAFMGILNACGYFFIPAFAPALFNLTSLLVGVPMVMIFNKINLPPILGMAIGVLAGGFVQAFSQLPSLLKAGYRVSTKTDQDLVWYREPALKKMLLLMLPGMVGLAATQVNFLINSILATSQEAGAVSWLNYAFRLMQFPIGIFGVSLALASLPLISQEWVNENFSNVSQTVDQTLKRVFAINLPCSMAFIFLSYPIVELIYQYGMFSADSTRHTAYALCAYSVGLTAYSCVKALVPVFYAMGNTRYPVISSVLSVILTIVFNMLVIRALGYWGLALGTSVAAIFNALYLLFMAQKLFKVQGVALHFESLIKCFFSYFLVSSLMGVCCYLTKAYVLNFLVQDSALIFLIGRFSFPIMRSLKMIILVVEGVFLMSIFCQKLGLKEFNDALHFFIDRFKKKLFAS